MEGPRHLSSIKNSKEEMPTIEQLKSELRKHILDNVIRIKELRQKGQEAVKIAWAEVNAGMQQGSDLINPKDKAFFAIMELGKDTQDRVLGHGVASHIPTALLQDGEGRRNFPIDALVNILATGVVRGDRAPLSGELNQTVFSDAPFILLSNKDGELFTVDAQGVNHLKELRTVLVNGQYESMIDDLRKAFPWVSFRRSEEFNDSIFEKKEPNFVSYDERIQTMAQREYDKRTGLRSRK